jgi:hypothetical protein
MSCEVTFEQRPTYIHATVTGTSSRQSVEQYIKEVLAECKKQQCSRLLIEECLEGPRLEGMDVFAMASEGSMAALGVFEAVAYVDPKMGNLKDFAESVAVNRGLPISLFFSVEEAVQWLQEQE